MRIGDEVIRLKEVWVKYNNKVVLEDINLSVKERDFLGIIGPNGGGKTTLLKVILGLIKPTCGKVEVLGDSPEKARRSIGYVPQNVPFDLEFPATVLDVVLMGRVGRRGLFRRYTREDLEFAEKVLDSVEMLELKDEKIGNLSGGEKQRVFIARALILDPKILLLDEPTASIDKPIQKELYDILRELNRKVTIILVSHDIGVISAYVNKIACLNKRLFYHGPKEISDKVLMDTYKCPVDLIAHGVPHRVLKEH